jgi:peptidoglycan/xylan/chitin deacetylase (PgdA/CDA1 family)
MDDAGLQRLRRWARDEGKALTPEGRAAIAAALVAAGSDGADDGGRAAALKWAQSASRKGAVAADRSAARAIMAVLENGRPPRAVDGARSVQRGNGRGRTDPAAASSAARLPRLAVPTSRRGLVAVAALLVVVAVTVVALVAGERLLAPSLEASGPAGVRVGPESLAQLAFTVKGGSTVQWVLDGRDVSSSATRRGAVQTLRTGRLADGEHRVEVIRRAGFFGASARRTWEFTVDTTPPRFRLKVPLTATRHRPLLARGRVESGARLRVEGRPLAVHEGRFTLRLSPPLRTTLLLEAVDLAGNRSSRRVRVEIIPRRPPVPVRAVHVTAYAWADASLRRGVMRLIAERRINAVEIDLKDESGEIGFDAAVPLGRRIGAVTRVYDLDQLVRRLHARGIRVIGRLVCFRDPLLAEAAWRRGERSRVVLSPGGGRYDSDYGGFTNFVDPAVRRYNIDVAVAAARAGVDDVLYDYVRRPDGPRTSMVFPGLKGTPERSIVDFVRETRRALEPYGTYLGVSVFGVAATRPLEVAQDIPKIAREADYIAPMVYPSHWGPGEYNVATPNSQPYEIVLRSLRDFSRQTRGTGARVVPWLQDFTLGVPYGEGEVRAQIQATRRDGIDEFLLWDPAVTYTAEALEPNAQTSRHGLAHARTPKPAATGARPQQTANPDQSVQPKPVEGRLPNELGEVPVIMHHEIRADRVGEYDQTPAEFRTELERLWRQGYWPVRASDLASGRLGTVPAGKTPVVLTFDDSTQFQFSYDARGRIKAQTAIGILLAFRREHPAFPLAGTFYVNREPFAGVKRGPQMLRWLVTHGFELGNHTKDHRPFDTLSGPTEIQRELVLGNEVITTAVPGYQVETMSLPLGVLPKPASLARRGHWNGRSYRFRGIMLVGAGPAPSPFSTAFDPAAIPRIRSGHVPWGGHTDFTAWYWLRDLQRHPERRYVSDGDAATISFPRALQHKLRPRFQQRGKAY